MSALFNDVNDGRENADPVDVRSQVESMNKVRQLARKELKKIEKEIKTLELQRRGLLKAIQKNSVPVICDKFNLNVKDVIEAGK